MAGKWVHSTWASRLFTGTNLTDWQSSSMVRLIHTHADIKLDGSLAFMIMCIYMNDAIVLSDYTSVHATI
jgi:hypothetical protein